VTARELKARLADVADPARVPGLQRFFKTGPGEYAEGDEFIGVTVPQLRALVRAAGEVPLPEAARLLRSRVHEERLLALLVLVRAFERGDDAGRRAIYELYLANTAFINNWDLVDTSAPQIVGGWLRDRSRAPLRRLAKSASLWERRIAILATFRFIRDGEFEPTLEIADLLLEDAHDLIHKAVGWMLREVGNRDAAAERRFLARRYSRMPRTMLRYAIEHLDKDERAHYMGMKGERKGESGRS
jgi:3-methyladenine DNA glycosylase AlkD